MNERRPMNRQVDRLALVAAAAVVFVSTAAAQQGPIESDLARLADGAGLQVFNRTVSSLSDAARNGLHLSEKPGDGVAYLRGITFTNGTIECDIRGKDVQQQSFVGIAFGGVDSMTYEAVYFRPFNFRADDAIRRGHSVQYIAHPAFQWPRLRAEHPGVYEQPVHPVPDPNDWFHARIVVSGSQVSVFVDGATTPSLVVHRLSEHPAGLVGLWVGNTSGGDFANLRMLPE
ncbi:MAG: hypothetical protein ABSG61_07100 [Gemmatimonadales bacterium]